jgi:hypothetical protein
VRCQKSFCTTSIGNTQSLSPVPRVGTGRGGGTLSWAELNSMHGVVTVLLIGNEVQDKYIEHRLNSFLATVINDWLMFFWVLMPCRAVGASISEKHTVSNFMVKVSHQLWRWRPHVSPKRWHLPTSLHSVKTQKNIIILTAVRSSYLKRMVDYWCILRRHSIA